MILDFIDEETIVWFQDPIRNCCTMGVVKGFIRYHYLTKYFIEILDKDRYENLKEIPRELIVKISKHKNIIGC